jgi:hypothetical protein
MAYRLFGGTPADFTVDTVAVDASAGGSANALVLDGGVALEAWTAISGGAQVTDLLLFVQPNAQGGAAPSGVFPSQADGTVLVWAQDTVGQLWIRQSGGTGQRWLIEPIDLNERVKALEDIPYIPSTEKGAALGVATLDSGGKVPSGQLPSGTGGVNSVNGLTGVVALTEGNTGFVPNTRKVLAGTGLTQTGSGALSLGDITITPVIGTASGTLAAGNHTHGGVTTSPRPIFAQVLSVDAPTEWISAAAADPYTWVCDGTNDEVQIQAAIDAAAIRVGSSSGGAARNPGSPASARSIGMVQLGGGRFNIGAAGIVMHTAVHLNGAGLAATELRAVSCNQTGLIRLGDPTDHLCHLSNFYMQGNSGGGGSCSAIHFNMTGGANTSNYPDSNPDSDHLIENLYVFGFDANTSRNGVWLQAGSGDHNRGNIVRNLQVRGNYANPGGVGIYFNGASDSYIEACHLGGYNVGYQIAGGNTKLIGNKSFYSNQYGVWVTSGRALVEGHESQDDDTGLFLDGVPGTLTGLVVDTSNAAGIRVSNDRLQIVGFNVFNRGGGRYATTVRGLWYDGAFTNCAIIGNVENSAITTPVSGTVATGTNFVTVS